MDCIVCGNEEIHVSKSLIRSLSVILVALASSAQNPQNSLTIHRYRPRSIKLSQASNCKKLKGTIRTFKPRSQLLLHQILETVVLELYQKLSLTNGNASGYPLTTVMGISSWVREDERSWTQKLGANILKNGPIPNHVGFIMDGNRRFADKSCVPKLEGHIKGFEKLTETLRWCLDLGITEVTVYVFSIENFKRPKEEVDGLMKLAKDKFAQLLEEKDKLMEEGVCVQIVGDWSLVPSELKPLMAKAMVLTKDNRRAKLNVAFAYTARNEITRGVSAILEKGIASGDLMTEDVDEDLLTKTFQILPSKPLDLLVRTSGETRLSDFLLWQSAESVLCFTKVLWPEFSYWHLLGAIFHYQLNYFSILQIKKKHSIPACSKDSLKRQDIFIEKLLLERWEILGRDADSYSETENSSRRSKEIIS